MSRRLLIRVVAFLLLLGGGAIINVAVAWVIDQYGYNAFATSAVDGDGEYQTQIWRAYAPPGFVSEPGEVRLAWQRPGALGFDLDADHLDVDGNAEYWEYAVVRIAGWPTKSLIGYRFIKRSWDDGSPWIEHANGFLRLRTPPDEQSGDVLWLPAVPRVRDQHGVLCTGGLAAVRWAVCAAEMAAHPPRPVPEMRLRPARDTDEHMP